MKRTTIMFKRFLPIILANIVAVAAAASSSSAAAAFTPFTRGESEFDGFFTGASFGISNTTGRLTGVNNSLVSIENFITGAPGGPFIENSNSINTINAAFRKVRPIGTVYAGYAFSCANVFLGAETFFDAAKRRVNVSFNQFAFNTNIDNFGTVTTNQEIFPWIIGIKSRSWQWGINLRPGLILGCNTLLYTRIGFALNKNLLRTDLVFSGNGGTFLPAGQNFVLALDNKARKKRANFRAGLGIEQPLCECLNLRADYIFTKYRRINASGTVTFRSAFLRNVGDFSVNSNIMSQSVTAKPENHAFMIGLNYYW